MKKPKPFYKIRISSKDNAFIVYKIGYADRPIKPIQVGLFCDNTGNGTKAFNKALTKYNIDRSEIHTQSTYEDFCMNLYFIDAGILVQDSPPLPKKAREECEMYYNRHLNEMKI